MRAIKRILTFFIILLSVTVGYVVYGKLFPSKGEFTLVNNSTNLISKAKIDICGQSFKFENLGLKQAVSKEYKVLCEEQSFIIHIEFSSGKNLDKEDGYLSESNPNYRIEIRDNEVALEILR